MALSQLNKKNANPDKYIYSGYGIGLDSRSEFQLPYGSVGENVIIFGIDLSSSGNIENEKKKIHSWYNSQYRPNTRIG